MRNQEVSLQETSCPSFEGVVEAFLTERFAPILEEYGSILEADPEYLSYHRTSTALRLQYELKLIDFPALCIGGCMNEASGECCILTALREAIRRGRPHGAAE